MSKCPTTGKFQFRDELAAKIALAKRSRQDKGERRAYRCEFCHRWHLTSKERT
jgi:hypothetical protein